MGVGGLIGFCFGAPVIGMSIGDFVFGLCSRVDQNEQLYGTFRDHEGTLFTMVVWGGVARMIPESGLELYLAGQGLAVTALGLRRAFHQGCLTQAVLSTLGTVALAGLMATYGVPVASVLAGAGAASTALALQHFNSTPALPLTVPHVTEYRPACHQSPQGQDPHREALLGAAEGLQSATNRSEGVSGGGSVNRLGSKAAAPGSEPARADEQPLPLNYDSPGSEPAPADEQSGAPDSPPETDEN